MSAPPDPNGSLLFLERRLSAVRQMQHQTSRNVALDILTGGAGPSAPRNVGMTYLTARALCAGGDVATAEELPFIATVLARAPVTDVSVKPFRIERPAPDRRPRRLLRRMAIAIAAASLACAAGLGLRSLDNGGTVTKPSLVIDDPAVDMRVASIESMPSSESVQSASTPEPLAPAPANFMTTVLDERFVDNARNWPNDPSGTTWLAYGTYWLAARHPTQFVAVAIPGTQRLGDSVLSAWFHKTGGPSGGGYGLIVRDQDPQARDGWNQSGHYYVFEAGDKGEIGVWLRDGDHWVDLLTWTQTPVVNRGTASNELTVTALGDELSFLVNGTPVATQADTLLHDGAVGIFAGGDDNEVALDRVVVLVPR